MNTTVYKVVFKDIKNEENYYSAMVGQLPHRLTLKYSINELTTPLIGKVFAFVWQRDAYAFLSRIQLSYQGYVMECEASKFELPPSQVFKFTYEVVGIDREKAMEAFWRSPENFNPKYSSNVPKGTVVCDSITPRKVLL